MHPKLQMSTADAYGCIRINSGARYQRVTTCFVNCRDKLGSSASSTTSCTVACVDELLIKSLVSALSTPAGSVIFSLRTIRARPKSQIFRVQSSLRSILRENNN